MFWAGVAFLGFLQVTAGLNMLPVPGLDGYSALEPHLSPQTQRALHPPNSGRFSSCCVLLIATPLNQYFLVVVGWFFEFSGVPRGLVGDRLRTDPVLVCLAVEHRLATYAPLRID